MLASCNKADNSSGLFSKNGALGALDSAVRADRASAPDPCAYLAAGEAESFIGKLKMPPYRATDDGMGDVNGDHCMYMGADGRQLLVRAGANSGAGKIIQGVPNMLGSALAKAGMGGMDSTAHRVMADTKGPWDQATWIPGGSLFVTKGDMEGQVDVSGSSGQQKEAVAVATLMVPRFGHPLDYDGAKAVAMAPKPKPHPASACDFLPTSSCRGGHRRVERRAGGGSGRHDVQVSRGERQGTAHVQRGVRVAGRSEELQHARARHVDPGLGDGRQHPDGRARLDTGRLEHAQDARRADEDGGRRR